MGVDPRWYEDYFEGDWLDLIALRAPPERTEQQTAFIVEALALEPEARVLDLACGHGRITIELARRGYSVTGLDLSRRSLEIARDTAEREGLEVEFIQSDMREIPFEAEFDAVISIFTAFGYFEQDEENQRVLDAVASALKPGAAFLIDFINAPALFRRYQERRWEPLEDGTLYLQEHRYQFLTGRNEATWTFIRPDGGRSELSHSLRLYGPHELARMIEQAGLTVEQTWGDFEGSELSLETLRLIVRARKA
jgi:2-polyprenyl-3-methyl-5-hydroxy-6-metoxy-1,4-benzoquinol methylase